MSDYYIRVESHVREVMSPPAVSTRMRQPIAQALLWAGFLTAAIGAPWLRFGYLFGTDWPGPRRYDFPIVPWNSAPLDWTLAVTSRVISSEWTGKAFVLGLLFVAAALAFRAAPTNGFAPAAVASVVYVFNPFVLERLNYGQMYVLAGYALLPWVAARLRRLFQEPSLKAGLLLGLSVALVGVPSSHMFLIAAVLMASLLLTHLVVQRKPIEYIRRVSPGLVVAAAVGLAASSYWVIPLVLGRGPIATRVGTFTTADLGVFAAVPDSQFGLVPNLLGLYGFWAVATGRFTSMKAFVPGWPAVLVGLLGVALIGVAWAFKRRQEGQGAWVAGLLLAAAIGLVLEAGVSSPATRGLVIWLDASFPLYRGMRDADKWAALLALVYSQLIAVGTAAVLGWIRARPRPRWRAEWLGAVATGLLLSGPIYYGNGLLFGMHGQLKPSPYPAGWYQADRVLATEGNDGRALFLPWHQYMTYSFVQNQNNVVASPAPTFFSTPILASTNPEVPGIAPPADPDQVAVTSLVAAAGKGHWADVLASMNVKYVLLARETDWRSYAYLGQQSGLVLVGDYGTIALYRNDRVP